MVKYKGLTFPRGRLPVSACCRSLWTYPMFVGGMTLRLGRTRRTLASAGHISAFAANTSHMLDYASFATSSELHG